MPGTLAPAHGHHHVMTLLPQLPDDVAANESAATENSFYAASGFPDWLARGTISVLVSGAYGVDVFFALSAYLITGLLLREREAPIAVGVASTGSAASPADTADSGASVPARTEYASGSGRLDVRGFYVRRILRIWPLYLSFVALAVLVSLFSPQQHLGWQYVAGYTLMAGNWVYVFHGLPSGITIPLWTVSIEEQFYLTWPLAVRRASVAGMAWIAVAVLLVANAVRVWLAMSGASLQAMEYNTFTRLDPIALGILLALVGSSETLNHKGHEGARREVEIAPESLRTQRDGKTLNHKGHEGTQRGKFTPSSSASSAVNAFPITAITLRLRRWRRVFRLPLCSFVPIVVSRLTLAFAGIATLVGCAAFNGWTNPESPETWRLAVTHPLIALASAAILMAFVGAPSATATLSTPAAGPRSSWLRNPALIYLGKISYGLYVVHVLGLFLAQRVTHPASLLGVMTQGAMGFVVTLALAAASYRWLETPFLKLKERFTHVQSRPV